MTACTQCGAPGGPDACRAAFDRMLAFEWGNREAFAAVHLITVATYSLQHPIGDNSRVLGVWRGMVAEFLDGNSTAEDFRRKMSEEFEGPARVRDPEAKPPAGWPSVWTLNATDAVPAADLSPTAADHIRGVKKWAATVRTDLDESLGVAH